MNSSKEAIIAAIKKNKPGKLPLPEHPEFPYESNLIEQFQASIKLNGDWPNQVKEKNKFSNT